MYMLNLLAAIALAQSTPPPMPTMPPLTVPGFAAHLSTGLPRQFRNYTLVSARAEGNLLVFTFDGERGWRGRVSEDDLIRDTIEGLCSDGDFLGQIGANGVRLDRLEGGRDLQTGRITPGCSARSAD